MSEGFYLCEHIQKVLTFQSGGMFFGLLGMFFNQAHLYGKGKGTVFFFQINVIYPCLRGPR
jgi:hypothetical protein